MVAMHLWRKNHNQEWANTSGKILAYVDKPKSLMTESNGQTVVIPLTVVRSLLEDNGYESHRMGTLRALQDELDKAIDTNSEVNHEAMVAEGALYQKNVLVKHLNEQMDFAEGELNTLAKFKEEVLKFAEELISKNATMPTETVGNYMKKRFK